MPKATPNPDTQRQNLHIPKGTYYEILGQSAKQRTPHTELMYTILEHGVALLQRDDPELLQRLKDRASRVAQQ